MAKERVLIAVKTYPTLSEKYLELACTAGFREDGTWIRLYPIPFRLLEQDKRYTKYQWIEAEIEKKPEDARPESYKIINRDTIVLLNKVSPENAWAERKRLILDRNIIHTDLTELIGLAKSNQVSLAIFKPESIEDLVIDPVEKDWDAAKLKKALDGLKQQNLFDKDQDIADFKIMPKIPFKFSYRFKDSKGRTSKLMIEDWEIGQLYLNCVQKHGEAGAAQKVKDKYLGELVQKCDLHLFLGTTYQWHLRGKNPFVIIGTFHPPIDNQGRLF